MQDDGDPYLDISFEDLKKETKEVKYREKSLDKESIYFSKTSSETFSKIIKEKSLKDHFNHKAYWSFFLMFIMLILVVFQCVLLGMVGGNSWKFYQYKWLLPALMVQNLAQIVGLVLIVVKALFKDINTMKLD